MKLAHSLYKKLIKTLQEGKKKNYNLMSFMNIYKNLLNKTLANHLIYI